MSEYRGYELLKEQEIAELNTVAKLYRHTKTGAEVLSLENEDDNKVFGITFRTPPPDSTGLPHIMEHSVLCGSRKYPVKEPFIELAKGSLKTFLNAFTSSDWTCYPIASQNVQDFYNLTDVYLDAVFHPRITPEVLAQEGWHYELDAPDGSLTYKGVVFNEMKGAYSSPESLVSRYSERSLFPDNVYSRDSGGDPVVIPELTYEQFRTFHETYYHPSNARIFFYGDDDPALRFSKLDEFLDEYEAIEVDSAIDLQPRLEEARRVVKPYPAGEDQADKCFTMVNWLLTENADPVETLALSILSHVLMATPASPLRKVLVDSGLGEDVIGGGLDDALRQLTFSVGLKGVRSEDLDRVETLIDETLARFVADGLDRGAVEASMNTVEFQLREQNTGYYPRGLTVMLQALTTWLHDGDPFESMAFEASLDAIKAGLAADENYFANLIRDHLVGNGHRTTVVLEPDLELQARLDADEAARLAAVRETMDEPQLLDIIEQARLLKEQQEAPDSPEALATIPSLTLADLDPEPKKTPTEVTNAHGAEILYHDLATNGIVYLDVGFDLHSLPQDLLPYVGLFAAALLEMGTESESFVELTQRIGRKTGGIHPAAFIQTVRGAERTAAWSLLRGKATVDQVDDLLAILRDVLLTVNLDDQTRFTQMLTERKARKEAGLVPGGHAVALSRLRAKFGEAYWLSEKMGGVDYLFFLRRLSDEVTSDWPGVLQKLERVRDLLINRNAALCNITVDGGAWSVVQPKLAAFLAELPAGEVRVETWTPGLDAGPEGLVIPANVNYVAKGANLKKLGYEPHGSIEVITHYLQRTYLWDRVRVQGGAYGVYAVFDPHSGVFSYLSYRDPNLLGTLDVYDGTVAYLETLDLPDEELVKGIIGAIGRHDAYQLPDARGYSAMARYLINLSHEDRQTYRTQLLGTTVDDFRALAETLKALAEAGSVVVLGAEAGISAAEEERGLGLAVTKLL